MFYIYRKSLNLIEAFAIYIILPVSINLIFINFFLIERFLIKGLFFGIILIYIVSFILNLNGNIIIVGRKPI